MEAHTDRGINLRNVEGLGEPSVISKDRVPVAFNGRQPAFEPATVSSDGGKRGVLGRRGLSHGE